jgi:hypothetical protein
LDRGLAGSGGREKAATLDAAQRADLVETGNVPSVRKSHRWRRGAQLDRVPAAGREGKGSGAVGYAGFAL